MARPTRVWDLVGCPVEGRTCACIMPDSAVLTSREEKPSADSCGDPYQDNEGFLPVRCGAEPVFNFSWGKLVLPSGSGDGDDEDLDNPKTAVVETTPVPRRTTPRVSSVTPNRSIPRLPSRVTPDPQRRQASFQQLLRMHLNTFNQRLSMLEKNTLDMKEGIQKVDQQQSHLSSQLKELIAVQSTGEKNKKVGELEKSYTDMEARLSRLEGRLEILIDGFTALAQEMNKMKRVRHTSRSPQERWALPAVSTAPPLSLYSTTQAAVKSSVTTGPLRSPATAPPSIPTPRVARKPKPTTSVSVRKPGANARPVKNPLKQTADEKGSIPKTALRDKQRAGSTPKPKASPVTEKKSVKKGTRTTHRPNNSRIRQTSEETTKTKFQLEAPSHKAKKQSDQANHKDPVRQKQKQEVQSEESKRVMKKQVGVSKRTEHRAPKTAALPRKPVVTTAKPATVSPPNKKTTSKRTSLKISEAEKPVGRAGRIKSRSTTTAPKPTAALTRTAAPVGSKETTPRKRAHERKNSRSGILDLLRLLKGEHHSDSKRRRQDGSLHVVLGKLAIPIRIIPDD